MAIFGFYIRDPYIFSMGVYVEISMQLWAIYENQG